MDLFEVVYLGLVLFGCMLDQSTLQLLLGLDVASILDLRPVSNLLQDQEIREESRDFAQELVDLFVEAKALDTLCGELKPLQKFVGGLA